jgi:hypothetical protein
MVLIHEAYFFGEQQPELVASTSTILLPSTIAAITRESGKNFSHSQVVKATLQGEALEEYLLFLAERSRADA